MSRQSANREAANTGCAQIDTWQVKEAAGEKYLAERSGRGGGDKTESGKEVSRYSLRSRARRRGRSRAGYRSRTREAGRANWRRAPGKIPIDPFAHLARWRQDGGRSRPQERQVARAGR